MFVVQYVFSIFITHLDLIFNFFIPVNAYTPQSPIRLRHTRLFLSMCIYGDVENVYTKTYFYGRANENYR